MLSGLREIGGQDYYTLCAGKPERVSLGKVKPRPPRTEPCLAGGICREAPRRVNFSSGSLPLKLLTDVKRIHDGEALQPAWPPGGFIGLYQGNAW
jgi:hypothetical protein